MRNSSKTSQGRSHDEKGPQPTASLTPADRAGATLPAGEGISEIPPSVKGVRQISELTDYLKEWLSTPANVAALRRKFPGDWSVVNLSLGQRGGSIEPRIQGRELVMAVPHNKGVLVKYLERHCSPAEQNAAKDERQGRRQVVLPPAHQLLFKVNRHIAEHGVTTALPAALADEVKSHLSKLCSGPKADQELARQAYAAWNNAREIRTGATPKKAKGFVRANTVRSVPQVALDTIRKDVSSADNAGVIEFVQSFAPYVEAAPFQELARLTQRSSLETIKLLRTAPAEALPAMLTTLVDQLVDFSALVKSTVGSKKNRQVINEFAAAADRFCDGIDTQLACLIYDDVFNDRISDAEKNLSQFRLLQEQIVSSSVMGDLALITERPLDQMPAVLFAKRIAEVENVVAMHRSTVANSSSKSFQSAYAEAVGCWHQALAQLPNIESPERAALPRELAHFAIAAAAIAMSDNGAGRDWFSKTFATVITNPEELRPNSVSGIVYSYLIGIEGAASIAYRARSEMGDDSDLEELRYILINSARLFGMVIVSNGLRDAISCFGSREFSGVTENLEKVEEHSLALRGSIAKLPLATTSALDAVGEATKAALTLANLFNASPPADIKHLTDGLRDFIDKAEAVTVATKGDSHVDGVDSLLGGLQIGELLAQHLPPYFEADIAAVEKASSDGYFADALERASVAQKLQRLVSSRFPDILAMKLYESQIDSEVDGMVEGIVVTIEDLTTRFNATKLGKATERRAAETEGAKFLGFTELAELDSKQEQAEIRAFYEDFVRLVSQWRAAGGAETFTSFARVDAELNALGELLNGKSMNPQQPDLRAEGSAHPESFTPPAE